MSARRQCLYCHKDLGEALPVEKWSMYPEGTITHGACQPACPEAVEYFAMAGYHEDRAFPAQPIEAA